MPLESNQVHPSDKTVTMYYSIEILGLSADKVSSFKQEFKQDLLKLLDKYDPKNIMIDINYHY